ncbi:MAG: hypothetical protein AseanaTS_20550 [Candidatus Pelagadaptatus aseana]|uniref:ABC transporter permease subunit n=1 Tax=Candidatus Pelagadaptatus aseana TaxID=3120508 RepID=UPI0039B21BC0
MNHNLTTVAMPADAFETLQLQVSEDVMVRPSQSYWQDAWRRLKANRRAIWSLYLIVALLGFAFVLPLVVKLDPESQDLTQISQGPSFARTSLIVDTAPWAGRYADHSVATNTRLTQLQLAQEPHTESVRLFWQPVHGAVEYQVYRHILVPSGLLDLGLPLGATQYPDQVYYEDRLKLKTDPYYYSVVALDAGHKVLSYSSLEVTPRHATSYGDALRRGLIDNSVAIGAEVALPRHLLGTDQLGRDMLARLVYGAQTSLFIGIVAPLLFVALGIVYGGLSGYLGGRADEVMMRFADFVIALPFLLFMILFRVAMGIESGESGITPMLIALVALGWPSVARLVRGQVLQLREQPFVEAAQLMGGSSTYLIWRHMLPNVMGVVLVSLTFAIPSAIFTEAFLSFIGMGVAPPTPSWGAMCNDGIKSFLSHPHELLFPALLISVTVLAFNLLGDGLRDALDAKMKGE